MNAFVGTYIGFLLFLLCLLQHSGSRIDCIIFSWSTGLLRKVDMPFLLCLLQQSDMGETPILLHIGKTSSLWFYDINS